MRMVDRKMQIVALGFVLGCLLPLGADEKEDNTVPGPGSEPAISGIGILPGFKQGERVPVDERNPYADRLQQKEKVAESGSEASKIIQVLESLQVRGVVRDGTKKVTAVLLGDLPLVEGRDLPQLLPSQLDRLYVSKLTETEVEITWRTESGRPVQDGRRLPLILDDRPKVEVVLPGQPDVEEKAKQRALLVAKPEESE